MFFFLLLCYQFMVNKDEHISKFLTFTSGTSEGNVLEETVLIADGR